MRKSNIYVIILAAALFFVACGKKGADTDDSFIETTTTTTEIIYNESDLSLMSQGLIDVQTIIPEAQVMLAYSTTNNFISNDIYGELERCYLTPEAAEKLKAAFKILREAHPEYTFLLYDGARPQSVQEAMWDVVSGTEYENYVANPIYGSIHSYGCAIDLTIVDGEGNILDMGTPFDSFEDLAQPKYEEQFLSLGYLTEEQVSNRLLLRETMTEAGWHYIRNEWWHFNAYPRAEVKENYKLIY